MVDEWTIEKVIGLVKHGQMCISCDRSFQLGELCARREAYVGESYNWPPKREHTERCTLYRYICKDCMVREGVLW